VTEERLFIVVFAITMISCILFVIIEAWGFLLEKVLEVILMTIERSSRSIFMPLLRRLFSYPRTEMKNSPYGFLEV